MNSITSEIYPFVSHTQFSGKMPSVHNTTIPHEELHALSSTTDIYFFITQASNKLAHDAPNLILKRIQTHTLDFNVYVKTSL